MQGSKVGLITARARVANALSQGKAIAAADGYIAATAKSHSLIVATRDTGPFEAAGLTVINPWNAQYEGDWGKSGPYQLSA